MFEEVEVTSFNVVREGIRVSEMTKQEAFDFFRGKVRNFFATCGVKGIDFCANAKVSPKVLSDVIRGDISRCSSEDLLTVARGIFPPHLNPRNFGEMEKAVSVIFSKAGGETSVTQ